MADEREASAQANGGILATDDDLATLTIVYCI